METIVAINGCVRNVVEFRNKWYYISPDRRMLMESHSPEHIYNAVPCIDSANYGPISEVVSSNNRLLLICMDNKVYEATSSMVFHRVYPQPCILL